MKEAIYETMNTGHNKWQLTGSGGEDIGGGLLLTHPDRWLLLSSSHRWTDSLNFFFFKEMLEIFNTQFSNL